MPPVGTKSKGKSREQRRSRSRHTTPSSVGTNIALVQSGSATSALVGTPLSQLLVSTPSTYDEILEPLGANSAIPDPKHLDVLAADLRRLEQVAENRIRVYDRSIRELSRKRKELVEQLQERAWQDRELEERQEKTRRDAAAKAGDAPVRDRKLAKVKKGRDAAVPREARPLTHGAHALARQDGLPAKKDAASPPDVDMVSVEPEVSHLEVKREAASTSMSSLSPPSRAGTPALMADGTGKKPDPGSPASVSSADEHQPPPAPAIPQYQTFGPDPTTFPDPTIYHIRDVTPGMSEDEIKEIYAVTQYPHDDLHDLIPGIPPDRDLSNAKPPNQVAATTFATYTEPYFRPMCEEDLAFLREKVCSQADDCLCQN